MDVIHGAGGRDSIVRPTAFVNQSKADWTDCSQSAFDSLTY